MTQAVINPPLSNIQVELLKHYSTGVSDKTLHDLKRTMAKFFLDRMRKSVDTVWQEKGYTDSQMQAID